jgi:DNA repair protein RecN (Recombination protein N)
VASLLQELSIQNFAIIPQLTVDFREGMTVLTGETGAGKSIIIDAMGLLTGGRGSTDYVRQGETKAVLEGLFEMPKSEKLKDLLLELGIEGNEDSLLVQRDIWNSGKNVCRVNGRMVNIATLRKIGEHLVDIHGQHEHQELMDADKHLGMLDSFGGPELLEVKSDYTTAYHEYAQLHKQVVARQKNEKAFAQRIDMLKFQVEEIGDANLTPGEEESLLEERNKLANYQKIASALNASYEAISGEGESALDRIGYAMNELMDIEDLDPEYKQISEVVSSAFYSLQEATSDLSRQVDSLDADESRLDIVEERLETIRSLKRKYGDSVEAILAYYDEITGELADSDFLVGESGELETTLKKMRQAAWDKGLVLRKKRKQLAKQLEQDILTELKELYMEKAEFEVRFQDFAEFDLHEEGIESAEFYITSNPGEPLKPLVKVASGGEMSRIMLALKTIFSKTQGITSIVFDEVDTGVSGRVAQAIADKIHQIAENSQVLCITHLPQVAARADYQYFIKKEVNGGRTQTSIQVLNEEERVQEIARMLAGAEVTKLALEHAKELLAMK